jgi:hypothetical protein
MARSQIEAALEMVKERLAVAAASTEGIVVLTLIAILFLLMVVLLVVSVSRLVGRRKHQRPTVVDRAAAEPLEVELQALRLKDGVRPVSPLEETFPLSMLPEGVYGFSAAPGLTDSPVLRSKQPELFEVHKLEGGEVLVVGFVSPADASARVDSAKRYEVVLHSAPGEGVSTPFSIPLSHVVRCAHVRSEQQSILEVQLDA